MKSTRDSTANEPNTSVPAEQSGDAMLGPKEILSALRKNSTLLSIGTLNGDLDITEGENLTDKKAKVATRTPWLNEFVRNELKKVFQKKTIICEVETNNKFYRIHAYPFQYKNAYVDKIMYVAIDLTREKQRELELQQSLEKEKKLGELKSKFVSMASHEFRNPLTSILASTFLLSQQSDNQEEEKLVHLSRIKRSVNKLTHVLNEFHALQRLEENKVEVVYTAVNVPKLIEEDIIDELKTIKKPNQQINYVHRGLSEVNIDYSILHSIVTNLTTNALKFSEGTVQVTSDVSDATLKLEVRDEGIGIPDDQQQRIFERYFKAKNALTLAGTGLGLHLVKRYVELLHGTISFRSSLSTGTTFAVTFPTQGIPTKTKI